MQGSICNIYSGWRVNWKKLLELSKCNLVRTFMILNYPSTVHLVFAKCYSANALVRHIILIELKLSKNKKKKNRNIKRY